MTYTYRHENGDPLRECPECDQLLTKDGSITIHCATNGGTEFNVPSCLDADGNLIDDDEGVIAAGQHAGTSCSGCGEFLINMEDVEEIET